MIGKINLTENDIGFLHVLDFYLWRASHELAHGRWDFWHHNPNRYADTDGDTYA